MTPETFLNAITPFFEYFDSDRVVDNPLAVQAWYQGLSNLTDAQLLASLEKAIQECDRKYLPSPKRILDLFQGNAEDIAGIEQWKLVIQSIKARPDEQTTLLKQLDPASDEALGVMGGIKHLSENVKPEYLHSLEQKRFLELRQKYVKAIAIGQIKPKARLSPATESSKLEAIFSQAEYNPEFWDAMRERLEKTANPQPAELSVVEPITPLVVDLHQHRIEMCDRANELLQNTSPDKRKLIAEGIEKCGYLTVVWDSEIPKAILNGTTEDF